MSAPDYSSFKHPERAPYELSMLLKQMPANISYRKPGKADDMAMA